MILKSVHIRSYKCIDDSEAVRIDPKLTCLVGKNESGKTAFMEALYRLNPVVSGSRTKFEELLDFPRNRRGTGVLNISEIRPVEAIFELEESDIHSVEERFGAGVLKSNTVIVSRNYANQPFMQVDVDEMAFVRHVSHSANLEITLPDDIKTLDELRSKLNALEMRPPSVNSLLTHIEDFDLQARMRSHLFSRLPKFLYFNEFSKLPGRFSIGNIQQAKSTGNALSANDHTALALLKLAGLEAHEFVEAQYEERRALLEAASSQITDEVLEYWSQNKNLRVEFDVDFKSTAEGNQRPPFMDVRIWNDQHRVSLKFDERSNGFVWFFSFLVFFSEFRELNEKMVLLIDEPGLGLHASAQRDLLRFMEEKLAPQHQVIYTAHSPFMIRSTELQRVRAVEERKGAGTKITENVYTVMSRDTIYPLQAALGHEISRTFMMGPDNLLVRSASDVLYLHIMSARLAAEGRTTLDPKWVIIPSGSVENIPPLIALLETQMKPAVLLNVYEPEIEMVNALIHRGYLEPQKLFPLINFTGGKEADLEDMFEPDFYLTLLRGSGIIDVQERDLPPGERILGRVEQYLGKKFDHTKPATHLLQEQSYLLTGVDEATLDRFEQLFKKVNATMNKNNGAGG